MALTEPNVRGVSQGILPVPITLAADCMPGDALGYNSGWVLADANGTYDALLIAGEKGASGEQITAYRGAVLTGFTGCTPGADVFLSDTAGDYSETASATSAQMVGTVVDASTIVVFPFRYQEQTT